VAVDLPFKSKRLVAFSVLLPKYGNPSYSQRFFLLREWKNSRSDVKLQDDIYKATTV